MLHKYIAKKPKSYKHIRLHKAMIMMLIRTHFLRQIVALNLVYTAPALLKSGNQLTHRFIWALLFLESKNVAMDKE